MTDRFDLHATGTPLHRADRLGAALGLAPGGLWIKRDDLTGVTAGGNKARKLEYLVADALAQGADTLVTIGAGQSNHVRATGSAARRAGLDAVGVLLEAEPPAAAEGNVALDGVLGVEVVWAHPRQRSTILDEVVERLRSAGRTPYAIPLGGTSPTGMQGYVGAARELAAQAPAEAVVVHASSSGGTQAGLVAGFGTHERVLGIDVGALPDLADRLAGLAVAAAATAGLAEPGGSPRLHRSQADAPYAEPTEAAFDAIRLAARTEGIVLDPVYTGRGLAGLRNALTTGELDRDRPIVFVHTGGLPALFSRRYAEWLPLPAGP
jgi:1-aminocyclopropane-1-carboxylate deaminase/D-cysteine desulfhydrase-like pyridoxal-dependent ACC family enzyme